MSKLTGHARSLKLKPVINNQILKSRSPERLLSLAKRIQVIESYIRKMNHDQGMFLDKPYPARLYSFAEMVNFKMKLGG